MKHIRAVCAAAIAGMLLLTGAAAVLHNKADAGPASVYTEPLAAAPAADDPLAHIADDYTVDAGFSTSLPLVVIASALVRTLVRPVDGKHFRPAETSIAQVSED